MGIHFLIAQAVSYLGLYFLVLRTGQDRSVYFRYTLMLTGLTGILALFPAAYLYQRDFFRRCAGGLVPTEKRGRLGMGEGLLLLLMGAALAEYVNVLVNFLLMNFDTSAYQESMGRISEGKNLFTLIFWIGLAAPVAEEAIFRWLVFLRLRDHLRVTAAAVLSGLAFGLYHGNLMQAVYASVLGTIFALVLEWSGSLWGCVLLHVGANTWSLIIDSCRGFFLTDSGAAAFSGISLALLFALGSGICYFRGKYRKRGETRLL